MQPLKAYLEFFIKETELLNYDPKAVNISGAADGPGSTRADEAWWKKVRV